MRVARPVLDAIAAPASLASYVRHTFPGAYDMAPHHERLIDALERVERGECKRLIVCMPPRRGKSELVSVRFPAWFLGRNPDASFMACSHTAALAYDFSRKVRRQFTDPAWPFGGVTIARDEGAVQHWGISGRRGAFIAAGVGGAITGKGADILSIDDPIKSRDEAMSSRYRDRAWDWYQFDAMTRLAPGGRVIVTMTRWHEDDLVGRVLDAQKAGGEPWEVLTFKEMAEEGDADPLGRAPGEVLWPARYPESTTRAVRTTQPAVWESLFQQRPGAEGGSLFLREWMTGRYDARVLPEFQIAVITVDSAFSTDVAADNSAIAVWGATRTHFHLIDVVCARLAYPDLLQSIRDVYAKWAHLSPWLYIEDKASGQSALQSLKRGTVLPALPFKVGTASKTSRAQDVTPYFAAGRVLLPESAPWLSAWIEEHVRFPGGAHDDRVDTTTMALKILARATGMGLETLAGGQDENGGERAA